MQSTSAVSKRSDLFQKASAAWLSLTPAWRWSLICFLSGRILYSAWALVFWLLNFRKPGHLTYYYGIEPVTEGLPGALLGIWQRWDALHHTLIAVQGYSEEFSTAFLPLYPFLSGLLHRVMGIDVLAALILVSNLAFLFALVVTYQLVSELFSPALARSTLITMVIFPTGFFYYAPYPISLLLLGVVLAIWLARHEKWLPAAGVAFLTGLVHPLAVLISIPIGVEAWQALRRQSLSFHRVLASWTALLATIANGLALGSYFLWCRLAGFQSFAEVSKQNWQRGFFPPWVTAKAIVLEILSTPLDLLHFANWINIIIFLLTIGLTVWSFRRIPAGLWLFQAALVGFLLINYQDWNPLMNFFRQILVAFPIFFEIAMLNERHPRIRLTMFTISLLGSLVCCAVFFLWIEGIY